MTCPGSRQAILRKHLNAVRTAIGEDTLPKVLETETIPYRRNYVDNVFKLSNGSEIWLIGLDDKDRTEKILGKEFFTLYFNECSEISWNSTQLAMTRCSMRIDADLFGRRRRNRMYFDCNPPSKRHWCYRAFVEKQDPVRNLPWKRPGRWDCLQMNPGDNRDNLGRDYIESVLGEYSGRIGCRAEREFFFRIAMFGRCIPDRLASPKSTMQKRCFSWLFREMDCS